MPARLPEFAEAGNVATLPERAHARAALRG